MSLAKRVVKVSSTVFAIYAFFGSVMVAKAADIVSIKDVSPSAWKMLSTKRIFFGHQSVGFNIIEGIRDVMKDNPQIVLRIVETTDPVDFRNGVFAHSRIGTNGDPKSKIMACAGFMKKGIGARAEIAFLKFCYVDFLPETDIREVFQDYKRVLAGLKAAFPKTRFVHFTVPLTSLQTGWKAWIKRIIGKRPGGCAENEVRERFNDMLRKEYDGREPVFDLARIESTLPDGRQCSYGKEGRVCPGLASEYTDDGGHLNAIGRRIVAERLLLFLAQLQ